MTIAAVVSGEQRWHVEHGEAGEVLRLMPDACVDAVVTDPPAGIAFMGKTWDHDHGGREGWVRAFAAIFAEALRVLKPGGRALIWSIPRTAHWTACAVEDAGFVIENVVMHVFGTGFPKGKGQLKPSYEPWILCRKPGGKVQPLQIDACRVGWQGDGDKERGRPASFPRAHNGIDGLAFKIADRSHRDPEVEQNPAGRWPPNLVLSHSPPTLDDAGNEIAPGCVRVIADWRCVDGCPVKLMGEQSGERPSTLTGRANPLVSHAPVSDAPNRGVVAFASHQGPLYADAGTAARFFPQFEPDPPPMFYCAKASRRERNAGCDGLPEHNKRTAYGDGFNSETKIRTTEQAAHGVDRGETRNHHPTVKPQALMHWLIRLITPPGGVVLDCFAGSGSTIVAAITEGCRAIGVEREEEYVEIARRRAEAARIDRATREPTKAGRPIVAAKRDQRQRNLFGDEP